MPTNKFSEGKLIIMGIDPGLNATGYGVIAAQEGRVQFLTAGTIRPPANQPLANRLVFLYEALARVIEAHQPRTVVLEELFTHHRYVTTATMMAHARGVACLLSAQHHVPVVDYPPTRVRKALAGYGSASKEQVARVVGAWLGVEDPSWSTDATDALALAIAHAHISEATSRYRGLERTRRRPFVALGGTMRWSGKP